MFFSEWWRRLWWTNRSGDDDLPTCTDYNHNGICDDEEPFYALEDTDDSWYDTDDNVWSSSCDDD